jgi:hypothetical protein
MHKGYFEQRPHRRNEKMSDKIPPMKDCMVVRPRDVETLRDINRKRHEDTLACLICSGGYASRLNRVGIQN